MTDDVEGGSRGADRAVPGAGFSGIGPVLRSPEFYAWILTALAGMTFQQSAFRAGALTASLPTIAAGASRDVKITERPRVPAEL